MSLLTVKKISALPITESNFKPYGQLITEKPLTGIKLLDARFRLGKG